MTGLAPFSERLLGWWEVHGRHDLPWQHPRTPYRVWISEVMLQQTQVATVIPYFKRWIARLPDLPALATADPDTVLAHWSGLGYYARARNLHKAALVCMETHGGALPDSPQDLASLPGIGASTANAIASQAHDRPLAILDGNAKRVLARHAAIEGWPGKSAVLQTLWQEAEARLPADRGADYTQAIMDLGATLCTRTMPACDSCPVRGDCLARVRDAVTDYPGRKPRKAIPEHALHWLLWQRGDGAVLLERRPDSGIWGGLWCLPEADTPEALHHRFELDSELVTAHPAFEHRLTHRRFTINTWRPRAPENAPNGGLDRNVQWFAPETWQDLGLPRPATKTLHRLEGTPS